MEHHEQNKLFAEGNALHGGDVAHEDVHHSQVLGWPTVYGGMYWPHHEWRATIPFRLQRLGQLHELVDIRKRTTHRVSPKLFGGKVDPEMLFRNTF